MNQDFEYELNFLHAAEDSLESYLLSGEIYWPLSIHSPAGSPPYPRFSLGWLLLYERRLTPFEDVAEVGDLLGRIDGVRQRWLSAWRKKAGAEFQVRLRLWTQFLNEYRNDHEAHASRYSYEVQRRTMLELLKTEAEEIPEEQRDLLAGLDALLRVRLKVGEFIRETDLESAFPKDQFWFLYGELKS